MKTRVCTKCGEEKPETTEYFYRNKASRGGLNTTCKACHNKNVEKWKAENPEKVRETIKRWQYENREKVRETVRRWQTENPEKNREKSRRWYAKNAEKVKETKKRWRAENSEKARERQRRRYAENPEKAIEAVRRWQAKNPEKVREAKKRLRNTLAPDYLKSLISAKYDIDRSEIGEELINAKRREITYYRQFKQLNQLKK
jgi:hypothetical protein